MGWEGEGEVYSQAVCGMWYVVWTAQMSAGGRVRVGFLVRFRYVCERVCVERRRVYGVLRNKRGAGRIAGTSSDLGRPVHGLQER